MFGNRNASISCSEIRMRFHLHKTEIIVLQAEIPNQLIKQITSMVHPSRDSTACSGQAYRLHLMFRTLNDHNKYNTQALINQDWPFSNI